MRVFLNIFYRFFPWLSRVFQSFQCILPSVREVFYGSPTSTSSGLVLGVQPMVFWYMKPTKQHPWGVLV